MFVVDGGLFVVVITCCLRCCLWSFPVRCSLLFVVRSCLRLFAVVRCCVLRFLGVVGVFNSAT